jgi:RNA polymerase sigma-70 factor (sigma-E family)
VAAPDEEFSGYVRGRYGHLVRVAFLLCGDAAQAEDVVQSALAKTYRAWPRIRDKGALDAYVRRAIVNESTSWWRRAAHRERPFADVPDRADETGAADRAADRSELLPALRSLPPGQRAVMVLRYLEDLSEEQTASALGVSTGTVKSQHARGLAAMRRALLPAQSTDVGGGR